MYSFSEKTNILNGYLGEMNSKNPTITWSNIAVLIFKFVFLLFTRYEELRNIIKNLKNHKKIKDMSNVLTGRYQTKNGFFVPK